MSAVERELANLAAHQHGVFTLDQARAAGLTERQVARRVASGRWVRVARGVIAVAGLPDSWHHQAIAPLLARPDAVLAERSAAHLHGLLEAPVLRPTLIVPPGTSARVSGAASVHRLALVEEDQTMVDAVRCTTPARTLVDLAGVVGPTPLRSAVDTALHRRSATVRAIDRALDRSTHLRRSQREALVRALEPWRGIRPGSPAEVRLLRQLGEWGLPTPERQVPILDPTGTIVARADVGWSAVRFGLEYDSDDHHGPSRWAADERRSEHASVCGWTLLRIGVRDLLPSSDLRRRVTRHLGPRAA